MATGARSKMVRSSALWCDLVEFQAGEAVANAPGERLLETVWLGARGPTGLKPSVIQGVIRPRMLPIANRRYSRLPVGATSARAFDARYNGSGSSGLAGDGCRRGPSGRIELFVFNRTEYDASEGRKSS